MLVFVLKLHPFSVRNIEYSVKCIYFNTTIIHMHIRRYACSALYGYNMYITRVYSNIENVPVFDV